MKKKLYSLILIAMMLIFTGGIGVCAASHFSINFKTKTINIGDEENPLILSVDGRKESDKKPRWTSWNENVARVDQEGEKGVVTALRKGKAVISSGIGFPRETCLVTVVEPSIRLNKTEAAIYRGKEAANSTTLALKATVKGADKTVTWSSSNENVVKVDQAGNVTCMASDGRNARTATITAAANGKTASCKVTVLDNTISLNISEMQLSTKGVGSSIKLLPTIVGANKKITWESSAPQIASVKGGKVTGKSVGEATITATANGVTAACTVKVQDGISINEEKVLLYKTGEISENKQLKTNAPKNANVAWSSSDKTVAEVDNNGLVTAKKDGNTVITALYNGETDTCQITVKETKITIAEKIVRLKTKGDAKTYALDYNVTGRKAAVKWTTSDKKVATVSKGRITAKKPGSAIVTAEANGVRESVKVTVSEFTPTITLNQSTYTLYTKGKGTTVTLKSKVDGANKNVEWQSSNPDVAQVSTKGKVTAVKEGRSLITAEANGVTAKCWIQVKEAKVVLEKEYYLLNVGDTEILSVDIVGAKQTVKYATTNTKAVSVKKGIITAKKLGSADVKVTANGITEICHVVVTDCKEHNWMPVSEEDKGKDDREASCEKTGLKTYVCNKCNGKKQEVMEPLGHDFGRWTVAAKATDNAAGLEKQVCSRCKTENTKIIPAQNRGESAYSYQLVWEDDFNGDKLNTNDWNFEYHEPGWVNAELQAYVDSEKNTYVKDGNLYIQAIKEIIDGKAFYTSGRINTQGKHDFQYGRFEARAKVPSGKGFLPAFWMMPTDESYYGQWPKCGEIDIMEVHGSALSTSYGTLHFGEPHTQKQGSYTLPEGQKNFGEDFHIFACEWDPDEFRFYVDDTLFYTVNDWFTKKTGFGEVAYPAPYDQPFYMILNLAVGGSWVGYPDEDAVFEENAQFVIDYVKVYQKDSYQTEVDKPENNIKLRDPDSSGNYIVNGDFAKTEDLSKEESNWQLLLAGEGAATAAISDNALHITTTQAGTLNYSVQIVQADLPMEKDCKYKLTYDAYADEARTMITGISAPDRGYIRYLEDSTVPLTKEKQSYEHAFDMLSDSDANGRIEFNLGNQGSTAAVHISNVRLEKAGAAEKEEKGILPDGNYVYNGQFNEGNEPNRLRLAYWDWDINQCKGTKVSVTEDFKRELKVVVPENVSSLDQVIVSQTPIAITGKKKYVLSFDAHADREKTIKVEIAGQLFESALTIETKAYKYEFETAADMEGSALRFLLGTAGTTFLDNVRVQEDGMIVNGDFSSGLTGYEMYVNDAAKVPSYIVDGLNENNAFSIDIADTGDQAWYIQLKQNNIKLEKDKWYKLAFDAKATVDRPIMYALQRDGTSDDNWTPYSGEPRAALTAQYQNFATVFQMDYDTDPNTVLSISMGAVDGKQIAQKHTVVIDNITLEETEPQEEPVPEPNTNLIQNGDFAAGEEGWESFVGEGGEAAVRFADGKAVYQISNVGNEDWSIQLKQKEPLILEKGASYQVTMKIKSTEARTIKYAFLDPSYLWYGGEDLTLTANEIKEVNSTLYVDKESNSKITFVISMGQIKDENGTNVNTPASTIEISDICVVKTTGNVEKPEEPKPDPENLISNGNFEDGKEGWSDYVNEAAKATAVFADKKARYEIINAGSLDWNVQLKQEGLAMEKGASYKVNFKIASSIDRDVKVAFMGAEDTWHGGADITLTANKLKSVSRIITLNEKEITGTLAFQISMGQIGETALAAHAVEISDISITEAESGAAADKETEEDITITPPEEGGETPDPEKPDPEEPKPDPEPSMNNLIQNGNFADGKEGWSDYVNEAAKATAVFADKKARYEIINAGSLDWNVQLKQEGLAMEKQTSYKVNFKIASSIDRDVKVAFMGAEDTWHGGADITLTANKLKSVSRIITLNEKEITGTLAFQISMGQIGETAYAAHAVEISDISITKAESGAVADKETEEDITITPPEEGGETPDPEKPDPEEPKPDPEPSTDNLIQNGDFAKGEDGWTNAVTSPGEAEVNFADGKAVYKIGNVGEEDWHIQLKYTEQIHLEKGASYQVTMKIKSTAARTLKYAFLNPQYDWYGGEDLTLDANEIMEVDYMLYVEKESSDEITFVISMGQIKDENGNAINTPISTIEIDDIQITKVESGTTQDKETEESKTEDAKSEESKITQEPKSEEFELEENEGQEASTDSQMAEEMKKELDSSQASDTTEEEETKELNEQDKTEETESEVSESKDANGN